MPVISTNMFYLLFPIVIIYLCTTYPILDKIGMIIICYAVGLTLGNIHILPENILASQTTLCEVSVALSLPLLLFSLDLKQWIHLAGKTILSMVLATISIAIDQSLCNRFLPRFVPLPKKRGESEKPGETDSLHCEGIESYKGIMEVKTFIKLAYALVLSGVIVGAALGISQLFPKGYATSVTILSITTLGIGCSFIPAIRNIKKTFQMGMYIIMIFCLVVSSMADFSLLTNLNYPLLAYVGFSVFGSMTLHAILCMIFKIDTDTFIITSTSAICSPPFVPVVASALKNKTIILSGLTTGIIGYAIGNYLGISMAYLVKSLI